MFGQGREKGRSGRGLCRKWKKMSFAGAGAYRLERRRHALVELVHPERPGLLLGYVILEANLRRLGARGDGSARAGEERRGSTGAPHALEGRRI